MSGHEDPPEAAKLTGISRYFNSITIRGRANVAIATYSVMGLLALYLYVKPKKQPTGSTT